MSFNPEVLKVDGIITKKEEKFLNKLKNKLKNNDINYFSNIEKSTLQKFVTNLKSELSKLKGKYEDKKSLINDIISGLDKIVGNDLKLYKVDNLTYNVFFKLSPEERLKFITKEHLKPQDIKEGTKITVTFNFMGKYNKKLYKKLTAGQIFDMIDFFPKNVLVIKKDGIEYTRKGLKGEFFTKDKNRLVIKEGTVIEIGKLLTSQKIESIKKHNEMKYKAYMGELKSESIQDEKLKKEFFDKDGKLLEKYKLDDKQKELFKQNPDIVKEAITRNIDPKFAVICFADAVKGKSDFDRKVKLIRLFTVFDVLIGNGNDINKVKKFMLKKIGGDNWKEKAKSLGLLGINVSKDTLLDKKGLFDIYDFSKLSKIDLRPLKYKYRHEAAIKNNNPAGLTYSSTFANTLKKYGISFYKGTKRPRNEGLHYFGFPNMGEGMKAYTLLWEIKLKKYANKTFGDFAKNWAANHKSYKIKFKSIWNKKLSSLTKNEIKQIQAAQMRIESPGMYKELKNRGIFA